MAQEHIDDQRAQGWLQQRLGAQVSPALYRRLVESIGTPPWSAWQEREALAMAQELTGHQQRPRREALEALERRLPLLTPLSRAIGEEWRAALEEVEHRAISTPVGLVRHYFFGTTSAPLPPDANWRDVRRLLEELAKRPRRRPPWRIVFQMLPEHLLTGQLIRFRIGDRAFGEEEVQGTALGELLELVRVLSLLFGVSPHEVLDYVLTGEPPYGLPWVEYREDGTVLVGGTPRAVAALAQELGRRGRVPWQAFEEFLTETRGQPWPSRLAAWNARYASRFGREFKTVSALRKACWTARQQGWG